jgi:tryptophan 2-C-methyltransferase
MNNTILLINPNRYRTPPVIPVGLEYVGASTARAGYDVRILDLCFEEKPVEAALEEVERLRPLLVGLTIRNLDSALFHNNVYFLPEIKTLIGCIRGKGVPVALGGISFTGMSARILDETTADYGIIGPGERAFPRLAAEIKQGGRPPRLTDGWKAGIDPDFVPRRPFGIAYAPYMENGGIIGFATQYGCNENCAYCIEAGRKPIFRNPDAVIEEIATLSGQGFENFHLCDSEFNLDLNFSETFASKLADAALPINWAIYMKPVPWSEKLFLELKRSGANVITLSVDSFVLSSEKPGYTFENLKTIIGICRDLGIRLAIDLLTGYPDEPIESTVATFEFFKSHRPDTVGVNAYFRVYPGTKFDSIISNRKELNVKLIRLNRESALGPVFYNHVPIEKLKELAGGDPLFKIEGFERTTNYERLS